MKIKFSGFALAWLVTTLFLTACGGGGGGGGTPPATLTSITITPATATIAKGQSAILSATGNYSDNTSVNITNQVTWSIGNNSIATINSANAITTAVAVGTTSVTATLKGITSNAANITVTTAVITGISISPTAIASPKGQSATFTATATYSDGATGNVSGSVTWLSSNATVATIDASGIASTFALGQVTVTAQSNGITSNSANLTVTAATLASIAITPNSASVAKGLTTKLTAIGTYTDGSTADITNQVTWISSSAVIATIGSTGIVTGISVGTTTISVSMYGITSPAVSLTVNAATLTGISISQVAATPKGQSVTLIATGTYSDGTTGNVSGAVVWASSNTAIATVSAGGIVTTIKQGSCSISASMNGIASSSVTLTVSAPALTAIVVTPVNVTVAKGLTTNLTAVGTYTDGSTADITNQVAWYGGNAAASIDSATGVITGIAEVTTAFNASLNGITSAWVYCTVTPAVINSISITPTAQTAVLGQSATFTATATYSDGATGNVSGSVTWISSNATVATLNASGIATTLAQGSTTITAFLGGITSNSTNLTVTVPVLTAINITPTTSTISQGQSTNFSAIGTYSNGSTANVTNQVTWSTSSNSIALMNSATGVATGVAAGSTTVTATLFGVTSPTATILVTATPVTLTSIGITPTTLSVSIGVSLGYYAVGTYSDGTTGDVSGLVTWISSNTAVAAMSASVVTTLSQGSTVITASYNGITSNSATLTVNPTVLTMIGINPATHIDVVDGNHTSFTATGFYSNNTTADISNLVTWSSGNTSVATITSNGVVTGAVTGGNTTIYASLNGISSFTQITVNPRLQMGGAKYSYNVPLGSPTAVATVAGSGTAGAGDATGTAASFANPKGIATDGTNLFVADSSNNKIRKIVIATGEVTTLAGSGVIGSTDGIGTAASFYWPRSITTDGTNLYVADANNYKIRKIVIATGEVSTLAGSGVVGSSSVSEDGIGTAASFIALVDITTDGSNLYVVDVMPPSLTVYVPTIGPVPSASPRTRIRKISIATGQVTSLLTLGYAAIPLLSGITTTNGADLYATSTNQITGSGVILKLSLSSGLVSTLAGGNAGGMDGIGGKAGFGNLTSISNDGTYLYVVDGNHIRKISIATTAVTTIAGSGYSNPSVDGPITSASFNFPYGITTDGISLYVTEEQGHKIRKIQY